VTTNDFEQHNGYYFVLIHSIWRVLSLQ